MLVWFVRIELGQVVNLKKHYFYIFSFVVFTVLVAGMSTVFGVMIGNSFPRSEWVSILGSLAQVIATFGTVFGAYWLATKDKRDQAAERVNRIHHLVRALHESICTQFERAQTGNFHEASLLAIDHEIELLKNIQIVEIPIESLASFQWFIRNAERQSKRLRSLTEQNFAERNVDEYAREIFMGISDTNLGRDCIYDDLGIPNPKGEPVYSKPYKYE